jgi:hypothetical protein
MSQEINLSHIRNYINNSPILNSFNFNDNDIKDNIFLNSINKTQTYKYCVFINCHTCTATADGQVWINDHITVNYSSLVVMSQNMNDCNSGTTTHHINDPNLSVVGDSPSMWESNKYLDPYGDNYRNL